MTALMPMLDRPLPLREVVDRLFQTAFTPVFGEGQGAAATIPTNVWETADAYQVVMLLPGVDPDAVEITAVGNTITVACAMQVNEPQGGRFIWREFGPAQYRRQIGLPTEFDSAQVKAEYRNGVLLLMVPKAEHSKARAIAINTGK